MTTSVTAIETAPTPLPNSVRWRILGYLSVLILILGFGSPFGGLIEVPISFFLKNKLHLTAEQLAVFRLLAGLPLFVAFAFGLVRDSWSPFGMRDRGYIVLFGAIVSAIYLYFAFTTPTYLTLLIAFFLLTSSSLFVQSAQFGLTSTIGQQHLMSGQVSAVWNIFLETCSLAAMLVGGMLSQTLEGQAADQASHALFFLGAAIMGAAALYGFWRPRVVFDNVRVEHSKAVRPLGDLLRLAKHRPVYPAMLIFFLWNLGIQTPMQYFLQNTLHATDADWGVWSAVNKLSGLPTFMLFGILCRRYPLGKLLFWGTLAAIPQTVPMLFMHSMPGAYIAAVLIGLSGGFATAAYLDLIIRSCPHGLQGTTMMLAISLFFIASRVGDVLGAYLYDRFGGFTICVVAITAAYALILPTLRLVPAGLVATSDGQTSPAATAVSAAGQ